MMDIYQDKYFINPAIEMGVQSYIAHSNGEHYNKMYRFEMIVISALCIIYGEKSILFPYKIDNERAFECNLLMYDLRDCDLKRFISYMQKYYDFMEEYKSEQKAEGIIEEIEKILIEMLKRKSKCKVLNSNEIKALDNIFSNHLDYNNLTNVGNKSIVNKYWLNTKENLTNTQMNMIGLNPDLLSREEYNKYGYDIRTIACLSPEEISKVNKCIDDEQSRNNYNDEKISFFKKYNLYLSSGSGFVDKIMLLSIAATELMIGFIIIAVLGGK